MEKLGTRYVHLIARTVARHGSFSRSQVMSRFKIVAAKNILIAKCIKTWKNFSSSKLDIKIVLVINNVE